MKFNRIFKVEFRESEMLEINEPGQEKLRLKFR